MRLRICATERDPDLAASSRGFSEGGFEAWRFGQLDGEGAGTGFDVERFGQFGRGSGPGGWILEWRGWFGWILQGLAQSGTEGSEQGRVRSSEVLLESCFGATPFQLREIDDPEARGQIRARSPVGFGGNGEDDRPLLIPLQGFAVVFRLPLEIGASGGEPAESV